MSSLTTLHEAEDYDIFDTLKLKNSHSLQEN